MSFFYTTNIVIVIIIIGFVFYFSKNLFNTMVGTYIGKNFWGKIFFIQIMIFVFSGDENCGKITPLLKADICKLKQKKSTLYNLWQNR